MVTKYPKRAFLPWKNRLGWGPKWMSCVSNAFEKMWVTTGWPNKSNEIKPSFRSPKNTNASCGCRYMHIDFWMNVQSNSALVALKFTGKMFRNGRETTVINIFHGLCSSIEVRQFNFYTYVQIEKTQKQGSWVKVSIWNVTASSNARLPILKLALVFWRNFW